MGQMPYPGQAHGFQPPQGGHTRQNSGGMPDMAAYAAAAAQQQQAAYQRQGGWPGAGGAAYRPQPPPFGMQQQQQHPQQQQFFQQQQQQRQRLGGGRPGEQHFMYAPVAAPGMPGMPGGDAMQQQQQFMPAGMQAVPVGLSPGMAYQFVQPGAMPGQQVMPGSMAQFQVHTLDNSFSSAPSHGHLPPVCCGPRAHVLSPTRRGAISAVSLCDTCWCPAALLLSPI